MKDSDAQVELEEVHSDLKKREDQVSFYFSIHLFFM